MKKNILFFTCEPGGAEVLIPVINKLKKTDKYNITVCSYGFGADRFKSKDISYDVIRPIEKGDTSLFQKYNPDIIITSACSAPKQDMSEKYLWFNANQSKIPTIAFLDEWQGYSLRFSGLSESEQYAYFPDYINGINEIGKEDLLKVGVADNKLIMFGHPYLSEIKDEMKLINRNLLRNQLGLQPQETAYLFASQPIYEFYENSKGYHQYTVLEHFLSSFNENERIFIKLHPKDQQDKFEEIVKKYSNLKIKFIHNEFSPIECIVFADIIFGMTSIMLTQSYIAGKIVVSLQPNHKEAFELVLSRKNYIPTIERFEEFAKLQEISNQDCLRQEFNVEFQMDKFQKFLDELLD